MVDGSTLPSYITFTAWTRSFSVQTSDQSTLHTYSIHVIATLPNRQWASTNFNVIFDSTVGYTLSSEGIENLEYIVGQSALDYKFPYFDSSNSKFYVLYYLYLANGDPYDTTLINFSQGDKSTLMTIFTNVNSKKGTYELKIVGKFTVHTSYTKEEMFTLTVKDECYGAIIYPSTVSQLQYAMYNPPLESQ